MSKSPAVKRLMRELQDLKNSPCPEFTASPLEDNIFEWHFTLRGPPIAGFQGGRYHGRLVFPPEYPFKPPDVYFLTPSGRFEIGKKICLSMTGYHPEHWRPAWGVSTALIAIISFFPAPADGAIGALDYSEEERAVFAKKSRDWTCQTCGSRNADALPDESVVPSTSLERDPEIAFGAIKSKEVVSPSKQSSELNLEQEQHLELETPINPSKEEPKELIAKENIPLDQVYKPNLSISTNQTLESTTKSCHQLPNQQANANAEAVTETDTGTTAPSFDKNQVKEWIQSLVPPRLVSKASRILYKSMHLCNTPESIKDRIQDIFEKLKLDLKIQYSQQDEIQLNRIKMRRSALERLTLEQKKIYLKDILSPLIRERIAHPHLEEIESKLLEMKIMDLLCLMELQTEFQKLLEFHQAFISQQKTLSSFDFSLLCIGLLLMMLMVQKFL